MDVKEARNEKEALENLLHQEIARFEQNTGMAVHGVAIVRQQDQQVAAEGGVKTVLSVIIADVRLEDE